MKPAVALAALAALAAGCEPTETVAADHVIVELVASPETVLANGAATTEITVATVDGDVKAGLKVKLSVSGAAWAGNPAATLDKELGPDGRTTAMLAAPRVAGTATVVAEIAGYERTLPIVLVAAVPRSLATSTSGRLVAGQASQIQVTAQPVLAEGGLPTAGTAIAFHLETEPAETGSLTTERVILDATATTAATTFVAGTTTTRGTITVTVTPPGATVSSAESSVIVTRLP